MQSIILGTLKLIYHKKRALPSNKLEAVEETQITQTKEMCNRGLKREAAEAIRNLEIGLIGQMFSW